MVGITRKICKPCSIQDSFDFQEQCGFKAVVNLVTVGWIFIQADASGYK